MWIFGSSGLSCCTSLALVEIKALSKLRACYPRESSGNPLSYETRYLIVWCSLEDDRLYAAQNMLYDMVMKDIERRDVNRVSVGMKIFLKLIQANSDHSNHLSITLTNLVLDTMQIMTPPFVTLAGSIAWELVKASFYPILPIVVKKIICSFITLYTYDNLRSLAVHSIAIVIKEVPLTLIPLDELIAFFEYENAHEIRDAVAFVTVPMTVGYLIEEIFQYIREYRLFQNETYLSDLCCGIYRGLHPECRLHFYRKLIETLPPLGIMEESSDFIIYAASQLVVKFTSDSCVSSEIASLLVLHTLYRASKNIPLEPISVLLSNICSDTNNKDILYAFYVQAWMCLPASQLDRFSVESKKVLAIVKYANTVLASASNRLPLEAIDQALKLIIIYLEINNESIDFSCSLARHISGFDIFESHEVEELLQDFHHSIKSRHKNLANMICKTEMLRKMEKGRLIQSDPANKKSIPSSDALSASDVSEDIISSPEVFRNEISEVELKWNSRLVSDV